MGTKTETGDDAIARAARDELIMRLLRMEVRIGAMRDELAHLAMLAATATGLPIPPPLAPADQGLRFEVIGEARARVVSTTAHAAALGLALGSEHEAVPVRADLWRLADAALPWVLFDPATGRADHYR